MVQVMAQCRPVANHYLSQYGPRSMSSYGITGHQRVNLEHIRQGTYPLWVWCGKTYIIPSIQRPCKTPKARNHCLWWNYLSSMKLFSSSKPGYISHPTFCHILIKAFISFESIRNQFGSTKRKITFICATEILVRSQVKWYTYQYANYLFHRQIGVHTWANFLNI